MERQLHRTVHQRRIHRATMKRQLHRTVHVKRDTQGNHGETAIWDSTCKEGYTGQPWRDSYIGQSMKDGYTGQPWRDSYIGQSTKRVIHRAAMERQLHRTVYQKRDTQGNHEETAT